MMHFAGEVCIVERLRNAQQTNHSTLFRCVFSNSYNHPLAGSGGDAPCERGPFRGAAPIVEGT